MTVHWEHNGNIMSVELVNQGDGWLSIGFGPRGIGMDASNIVMGYIDSDRSTVIIDKIGVRRRHLPDKERAEATTPS